MPDLPRVPTDAPDADDLPSGRQVARPRRRLVGRLNALVLTGTLAVTLAGSLLVSSAQADDLTDRRDELKQQISQTQSDLDQSSSALDSAGAQVDQAESNLADARAELSRAQSALVSAKAEDVRLAAKLKRAQTQLAAAKAAVLDCEEQLAAKKQLVGVMVRTQYQQQTNLMPIAVLSDPSTADVATRVQWATTMFDTTQARIDDLLALEAQLKARRASLTAAEEKVAKDRAEAADSLAQTRTLEAQAQSAAAAVAGELVQRQAAERAAAQAVAQDRSEYSQLSAERTSVEHRIAVRIAKQKAEAAAAAARAAARAEAAKKKAAAAQRAAEARAVEKAVAEAKAKAKAHAQAQARAAARSDARAEARAVARAEARAATRARAKAHARAQARSSSRSSSSHVTTRSRSTSRSSSSTSSGLHHGFIYPSSASITSPYGMRFHPILHVWKLHDGTDFGAGCGTQIRAAYGGTVAEKYYNSAYGNRLMIDHGKVDGRYVTTGYNHAIRYVVGVGQHVRKGQVIGYVGETGYATGCHLHLMVWLDGTRVNPMTWF